MNFYFYDLETTGLNPFEDRIMQFGGQKLDKDLKPISEVDEFYVQLSEDILPSPQAIATHQILPQTANLEGLNEVQFLKWLNENVYDKELIYSGYNNVDFDNQFMRWLHWRNFAPISPMNGPSSLDIYRLMRLAADLRPDGVNWPLDEKNKKQTFTLTALAMANKIDCQKAHSAGADVLITVALAQLIKKTQSKLFDHFLKLLKTDFIKEIILDDQPFIYNHPRNLNWGSSTTLATVLCEHPTDVGCYFIYDLRCDPQSFNHLSSDDLSLLLQKQALKNQPPLPFFILDIKQAPVVAPLSVLDKASALRLKLDKTKIFQNLANLRSSNLAKTVPQAYLRLAQKTQPSTSIEKSLAFSKISDHDHGLRDKVFQTSPSQLADLNLKFDDGRFLHLKFLYQARNFPKTLKTDQILQWEQYKEQTLLKGKPCGLDIFKKRLRQALNQFQNDPQILNILEELQYHIENILPEHALYNH